MPFIRKLWALSYKVNKPNIEKIIASEITAREVVDELLENRSATSFWRKFRRDYLDFKMKYGLFDILLIGDKTFQLPEKLVLEYRRKVLAEYGGIEIQGLLELYRRLCATQVP